uniref:Ketosynthase family 3 (KS3) domain-containing protein n=1 Tax=Ditylenchus dipsaci TaxID=166011 RepID=A0A915DUQ8_9BILA
MGRHYEKERIFYHNSPIESESDNDEEETTFVPVAGVVPNSETFDPNLFQLSTEDLKSLDLQTRKFLEHAYAALEKSGYIRERIGCFVGAEPFAYVPAKSDDENRAMWTSHMLDLKGPYGEFLLSSELCIAGAVHLVHPQDIGHHYERGMVLSSNEHCRPFFSSPEGGIIRGSCCSAVVLKDAKKALSDGDQILAVIKAISVNNDGANKSNFMSPSVKGQQAVMNNALQNFMRQDGDDHLSIAYLECHATGTVVGDEIELKAVSSVFGQQHQKLPVGSVKANIGHCFAASGMASVAKCIKILQTLTIPPQLHGESVGKGAGHKFCDHLQINTGNCADPIISSSNMPVCVAINNFGIGGTNASMVLMQGLSSSVSIHKKYSGSQRESKLITGDYFILPISGTTPQACVQQCHNIAKYMRSASNECSQGGVTDDGKLFKQVASTLQNHRDWHRYRTAITARTISEAILKIENVDIQNIVDSANLKKNNFAFFFCPQGVQYPGMLSAEIQYSDWLKKSLHELCSYFSGGAAQMLDILATDKINNAKHTQCALFVICQAITIFLKEAGISNPKVVFGHSVGEYSALVEAGVLEAKTCLQFLETRGELVSKTKDAKMIVVHGEIDCAPQDLELSAKLSSTIRVFVGLPKSVESFAKQLKEAGVEHRLLKTFHGFHSSFLEPIREAFYSKAQLLSFSPPNTSIISNVDGDFLSVNKLNAEYITQHLLQPVRMDLSLKTLIKEDCALIVEIGPPGMLKNLIQQKSLDLKTPEISVLNTMYSRSESLSNPTKAPLFDCLARLWELGCDIHFRQLYGHKFNIDYNLPGYHFQQIDYSTTSSQFQPTTKDWNKSFSYKNGNL